MLLFLIGLGFLFILLIMIFFINPPEAWLKKVFYRDGAAKEKNRDGKGL